MELRISGSWSVVDVASEGEGWVGGKWCVSMWSMGKSIRW